MRTFAQTQNQPQKRVSSLARSNMATSGPDHHTHPILHLQRTIGNQVLLRMLQSHTEEPDVGLTAAASPRFGHDFSRIPIYPPAAATMQTKLAINHPGDIYEQEADRMSDQVMRMPEPQLERACPCGGECPKCQTSQPNQEHERLQTKPVQASDTGQIAAPPIVREVLAIPGQPLDPATRGFMEPRFGNDFSMVRVHSDATAEQSARDVSAHAYTVGHNIVFGAGRFEPGTHEGRRLLAHELTHVVQQGGATPLCHSQFKRAGHEAAVQEGAPPLRSSEHSTRLQRQPKPNVSGDDPWERHRDIPKELHPVTGTGDVMTLTEILFLIGEAARIRHDFQTALGVTAPQGPRRLHVTWESEFAKGFGPGQPPLAELAYEHYYIETQARYWIELLQNEELAWFLSERIGLLFPDIGFSETGRALRRLGLVPKVFGIGYRFSRGAPTLSASC